MAQVTWQIREGTYFIVADRAESRIVDWVGSIREGAERAANWVGKGGQNGTWKG